MYCFSRSPPITVRAVSPAEGATSTKRAVSGPPAAARTRTERARRKVIPYEKKPLTRAGSRSNDCPNVAQHSRKKGGWHALSREGCPHCRRRGVSVRVGHHRLCPGGHGDDPRHHQGR